jgi:hypothetical protein
MLSTTITCIVVMKGEHQNFAASKPKEGEAALMNVASSAFDHCYFRKEDLERPSAASNSVLDAPSLQAEYYVYSSA